MKILLVYLPFCTPVSPPYSLTNLHAFLTHNSSAEIKVLDLNIKYHALKFPDAQKYFQSRNWEDYEKFATQYHQKTKEVYTENNKKVVNGELPEYFDELLQEIKDQKPDLVAFSIVYSSQAFYAHALLQNLECTTVVGGPCVNDKLQADHHFKNEIEFLNFIEKKKHDEITFNFPLDYSIYNLEEYFVPSTVIPLKTSSTCYYQQCTFCAHYANVPYMEYPIENISKTIEKSGKKHFFLIDDMIPVKRLLKLSKVINGKWGCQLRPTKEFTKEVLKKLYDNGLTFVLWGVESGSQKVLDKIKKGTNVKDIEQVLSNSSSVGIKNVTYIMFGFPGETEEDFVKTINFIERNDIDLVSTSTFGLQKGTPVYENFREYGITSIQEKERTVLEPKICYTMKNKLDVKKLRKKYPIKNKYPKSLNFFREHLFFM